MSDCPGPGLPWQVAAHPHGAALCPSRKCPHPKRIICIWKPLIRLHAWLRHHPHSSPLCCSPGQGAKPPRDLLLEPQTTLFPSTGRKQGLQPRGADWGRRRGRGCWQVSLAPVAAGAAGVSPAQHRDRPWALSAAARGSRSSRSSDSRKPELGEVAPLTPLLRAGPWLSRAGANKETVGPGR